MRTWRCKLVLHIYYFFMQWKVPVDSLNDLNWTPCFHAPQLQTQGSPHNSQNNPPQMEIRGHSPPFIHTHTPPQRLHITLRRKPQCLTLTHLAFWPWLPAFSLVLSSHSLPSPCSQVPSPSSSSLRGGLCPTWEPFTFSSSAWSTVCLRPPRFSPLLIPLSCFTSFWHSLPREFSISGALPICPTGTKVGLRGQGHHLVWTCPCQSDTAEEVPSQGTLD